MLYVRVILCTFCLLTLFGAGVSFAAQGSAMHTVPKKDAVILPFGPGFAPVTGTNAVGNAYAHNEGIVIRGSTIKDGKIVIPPGGIYYTNRGPRSYHLRGDVLNMLGKPYHLAYFELQAGVLANHPMKPGDSYAIVPDKVLTLTKIAPRGRGHATPVAHFVLTRQSGVPVSDLGTVSTTPLSQDIREFKKWGVPTGVYGLDAKYRFDQNNWTTDLYFDAGKHMKTGKLTNTGVVIEEALFHTAKVLYLSKTAPVSGYYAAGSKADLGGLSMTVAAVDEKAGTAKIRITDKAGGSTEKTLGPLDTKTRHILLNSILETHTLLSMRDPGMRVQVELSPYAKNGLFNQGKVALNLYKDLQEFKPGMDWPTDKKFLYRPDT